MGDDSEVYVDSDEDEIFFGCINEKEQKFCSKLTQFSGRDLTSNEFINRDKDVEETENSCSYFANEENNSINQESETCPGLINDDIINTSVTIENELSSTIDNDEAYYSIHSNNVSVELDHNYSYMKQKIDKSILGKPKSVVKADKDGGFLKVLSEIALVKAEADNKSGDKKDDEDKENKIVCIPEIRVTEATPEKPSKVSPSQKINMPFRRIKIIYNSPKCSDNFEAKQRPKAKSFTETTRNNNNNILKSMDNDAINADNKMDIIKKSKGNSLPDSMDFCNTTVNLTEFKNHSFVLKNEIKIEYSDLFKSVTLERNNLQEEDKINKLEILTNDQLTSTSEPAPLNCFLNDTKTVHIYETGDDRELKDKKEDSLAINKSLQANSSLSPASKEENESCLLQTNSNVYVHEVNSDLHDNESTGNRIQENFDYAEASKIDSIKSSSALLNLEQVVKQINIPPNCRFSKEARKIVEALKSSASDDTLNFTIPEIDLEDIEDSFTTPKPSKSIPILDETIENENISLSDMKPLGKNVVNRTPKPWKTVPKDYNHKQNPIQCADKIEPIKYFSDRKIQTGITNQVKKCVKKLPIDEKAAVATKGGQSCEKKIAFFSSSKIPVFSTKPCKLPTGSTNTEPATTKMTPFKIPQGKTYKNPKFKNVASPINAYIHNKPTELVVNVKPQSKNDLFLKALNNKTNVNTKKKLEKTPSKEPKLPFVEYRSATPFKLEKYPDSRLPRLAPTVQKLIGSSSPKVMAHKGRFFMKSPLAKPAILNNDSTIIADPNEVSVMVCHVAQKSNTMK